MKFLIKFTSRSRQEKMIACLDNIIANAGHGEYYILLTLDIDDPTCANKHTRDLLRDKYPQVAPLWGFSESKCDAINRDIYLMPEDWDCLICMSDDMFWINNQFLSEIQSDAESNFNDTDFFLHYPDGAVNERLATMSIIGKKYFDRTGYIYHPAYKSLFCDQEAQEVAKRLGKYKYINKHLFEHRHPIWNKAPFDEQYRLTESFYEEDGQTFNRRQAKNFDL